MSGTPRRTSDPRQSVLDVIGEVQYEETGEFPVEQGYIWTSCSSVENGNPLFWDPTPWPTRSPAGRSRRRRCSRSGSARTTGRPAAPRAALPLQVHFDLKELFGLPEAVMTDNTIVFHEPVRPGDILQHPPDPAVGERAEDHEARHRAGSG